MTYPFLFLNHGPIDPDTIDKCEEVFLWFSRTVTPEERKKIVETCPAPIGGTFTWGDRFCYFGSAGDTYDYEILSAYEGEAMQRMLAAFQQKAAGGQVEAEQEDQDDDEDEEQAGADADEDEDEDEDEEGDAEDGGFGDTHKLVSRALPRFVADVEKWANDVHAMVPIVFFEGPHGADEEDPWNAWSHERIWDALGVVRQYAKDNPWIEELVGKEDEGGDEDEEELDADQDHRLVSAPRGRAAQIYGWILGGLMRHAEGRAPKGPEALEVIEALYARDGIAGEISRLSYEEHNIHSHGEMLAGALANLPMADRLAALAKLDPYTELAFYASYPALRGEYLLSSPDPIARVKDLVARMPARRAGATTGLLVFIADNLVHATPAFDEPDKTHAPLAAEIMALACARPDAPEGAFTNGGTFYEWAGKPNRALELALLGHSKNPTNPTLINNVISAANLAKKPDVAAEYAKKAEALPPDEKLAVNQSFAFVQSGNLDAAASALESYIAKGGKPSGRLWANLLYVYDKRPTPRATTDALADQVLAKLVEGGMEDESDDGEDTSGGPGLLSNLTILLNNTGRAKETLKVCKALLERGDDLEPPHWCNLTYACTLLKDPATHREVLALVRDAMAEGVSLEEEPNTFENVAEIHADLGEGEEAVKFLKLAKEAGFEPFEQVATMKEFAKIADRPDFKALFEED